MLDWYTGRGVEIYSLQVEINSLQVERLLLGYRSVRVSKLCDVASYRSTLLPSRGLGKASKLANTEKLPSCMEDPMHTATLK